MSSPEPACPACGRDRFVELFEKASFRYQKCLGCGLIRLRPQPSVEQLERLYQNGYFEAWGGDEKVFREMKTRTFARILDAVPASSSNAPALCDVGAATGIMMELAEARGFDAFGVECSDDGAKAIREKFGAAKLFHGRFGEEGFAKLAWGSKFDVVVMCDLLEHLADPLAALAVARGTLKPGGVLALCLPDSGSFSGRLAGRSWSYFVPEHLFTYGRKSLGLLLERSSFEILSLGSFPKFLNFRYAATIMGKNPGPLASALKLAERMAPRVLSERVCVPVPCGQMLCVARRS